MTATKAVSNRTRFRLAPRSWIRTLKTSSSNVTHTLFREMSYLSRERISKIQPVSNWITNQIPLLTQYNRKDRGPFSTVRVYCICDSVCSWTVANPEANMCHRNIVTSNGVRAECCSSVLFKVEGRAVPEKHFFWVLKRRLFYETNDIFTGNDD